MIRRPPRSTLDRSSAASDVYKRQASVAAGETKYIESEAYSIQEKNYFRADVKISFKRNRSKSTVTWSLDVQNVSNNKNVYGEYFDPLTVTTKVSYKAPLIQILEYRIDF